MADEELNISYAELETEVVSRKNVVNQAILNKRNELKEKLPVKSELIENSFSSLTFVNGDTLREYRLAFIKDGKDFPKEINLTDGMVIFLMLSNTLNNLDRKVEKLTAMNVKEKPSGKALGEVMSSGRSGIKKSGERISHIEMLDDIGSLAMALNLDTSQWKDLFNEILRQQERGMTMVKKYTENNKVYSLEEALEYRLGTVGNYYYLLATCLPSELKSEFLTEVGLEQLFDDIGDVSEDEVNQVNPFVALLKKYGILDKYKAGKTNIIDTKIVGDEDRVSYSNDLDLIYSSYGKIKRNIPFIVRTKDGKE